VPAGELAQRNGDGSIRVYVALRTDEDPTRSRGSRIDDEENLRGQLRATLRGWSPQLLAVLDGIDGEFTHWPLHGLPARQDWAPHQHLTLVGDAAHVMPPFTGQGVNMALLDAVELVDALHRPEHRTVDDAIAAYERAMLDRMAEAIPAAYAAGDLLITPDGPQLLLAAH